MSPGSWRGTRRLAVLAVATSTVVAVGVEGSASALTNVASVKGSAYGYFLNVSLFGGTANKHGPLPKVSLRADASNSPRSASLSSASVLVGPAVFFSSGPLTVSTSGSVGASGSVASSTRIDNVNTSGEEVLTASRMSSSCNASSAGVSGSASIVGGVLYTDSGEDLNGDEDYNDAGEHAPVTVAVPANPAPNTTFSGHIHLGGGAVDKFKYVFNEQTVLADGSIRVHAGRQKMLGPTAVGNLYLGRAICGVS